MIFLINKLKKIWMYCQFSDQNAARRFDSTFNVGKLLPPILLLLLLLLSFCVPDCVNEFYLFTGKNSFKIYTNEELFIIDSTCTNYWWHMLTHYFSFHCMSNVNIEWKNRKLILTRPLDYLYIWKKRLGV